MPADERPPWLHPHVEIATSAIAGRGWFATEPFVAGTAIARLAGREVDTAELRVLFTGPDYIDTVTIGPDRHLVLATGTPLHFGNHSCDPNLGWSDAYTLVTTRDVAPGTELVQDYATSTADPEFTLYCHCETYRCRQVVEGTDWRIPQLQQRYAGHWSPAVQALIDGAAR